MQNACSFNRCNYPVKNKSSFPPCITEARQTFVAMHSRGAAHRPGPGPCLSTGTFPGAPTGSGMALLTQQTVPPDFIWRKETGCLTSAHLILKLTSALWKWHRGEGSMLLFNTFIKEKWSITGFVIPMSCMLNNLLGPWFLLTHYISNCFPVTLSYWLFCTLKKVTFFFIPSLTWAYMCLRFSAFLDIVFMLTLHKWFTLKLD